MKEKEKPIKIIGSENVFDAPDILEKYACDESFVHPIRPEYVVKPKDAEQVNGDRFKVYDIAELVQEAI